MYDINDMLYMKYGHLGKYLLQVLDNKCLYFFHLT